MTIYELNKVFSSENKSKIISHFWDCHCENENCVTDIQNQLGINQSNLSKHIGVLLKLGVLTYKQVDKERYYKINPKFKEEWKDVVSVLIKQRENKQYTCKMCQGE